MLFSCGCTYFFGRDTICSIHYPTSHLFPSDGPRFARWIASLSWSWLSNPKVLSVFTSLPALQTVKSGWPRGQIIPPSSLEVVVVPCGACRTVFFVAKPFFSVADDFGGRRMPRKKKRHNSLFVFLLLFDLLEVNKHHFPHAISECVCCQSNWAGRPGIAITFWRFRRSLDHSHLRGQVDEFLRFMFCYVVPSMEHIK